ncbi:hypothetical protein EXN24_17315 [Rhizobium rhizogenes]|uniref:Uncharacterized protein n=1 Tax=Rhizobium rhizogenes TaxID=359 RepID=A0AA94VBZ3_RHIRH|nr:hypothetical protein EXN24_17315 [Rhizobium rhizogenes]
MRTASSARASSSSAAIWRRSSGWQWFISARSSSICCSSSIVISLTFEKDDAAGREEMTGSRIASATARGGEWGAGFVEAQGTGAEAKSGGHAKSLRPAFARGTIGHSEQTPPLRIATGRRSGLDARFLLGLNKGKAPPFPAGLRL